MKILCYGDSNTWGYIPNVNGYSKTAIAQQYNKQDCWWYPLTQQNELFINGLCGRCIAHENKWLENRNAFITIEKDFEKYNNIDLIILQLGTNDCKCQYDEPAEEIAKNFQNLINKIKSISNAHFMIISPAQIKEDTAITQKYYKGANKKSIQLNNLYEKIANKNGFIFVSGLDLDIGEDGEHLTLLGHKQLSQKVIKAFIEYEQNLTKEQK